LGAKSLAEGQKGLLLAAFLKILGPLILVLPGMIAYHYFEGGLASSDLAYPELVRAVLPKAMVGFFAAVLFGAILSSFNSVLNSSVTLFGIDIYKQHINKDASEATVVKYGKIFGVCLALAAMFIAPLIANAGSLFNYLQEINGIYSIPILTIIVVGYLTKRVPAIAAKIGILSGSILYIISQFILKPNMVEAALEEANAAGITDLSELAVIEAESYPHYLHVMAILFVSNIIIMLVIGKFMPRKEPFQLQYTQQVNIEPYKYVKQVGFAVVAIVVAIYIYFAK
jgi:SSS family solute:Na+ symporter